MRLGLILFSILAAVSAAAVLQAETPATQPSATQPATQPGVIRVGDTLEVIIDDLVGPGVETKVDPQVSDAGNVKLPLVGEVKAVGLTTDQAEGRISDAYSKAKIIDKAQVSVRVLFPATRPSQP